MNGQAAKLHARMAHVGQCADADAASRASLAHTVAIGSGKGGVGKSTVALAIAWAAAERGVKTALIDADLGLANLDIMCGVQPVRTAADWLAGRAVLAECFTRLAPRLWLLPGASGVARLADLGEQQRLRLLEGLARVASHVDFMVVDLGAGLGAGTLDIAAAADKLLVVCTPEPTSIADAYGFIKACARRGRTHGVKLAVNMATDSPTAQRSAARVCNTATRYLDMQIDCVGAIPMDASVRWAVHDRQPLLMRAPHCDAARAIRAVEGAVAAVPAPPSPASPGFLVRLARTLGFGAEFAGVKVEGQVGSRASFGNSRAIPEVPARTARVSPAQ